MSRQLIYFTKRTHCHERAQKGAVVSNNKTKPKNPRVYTTVSTSGNRDGLC